MTQTGSDNERLISLVERARECEPEGIKAVDGDSGFFRGDSVAQLIQAGVDVCIPDSTTACELHRGMQVGTLAKRCSAVLEYDEDNDSYCCQEGNTLTFRDRRQNGGLEAKRYRAKRSCRGCPRYEKCLVRPDGKPAKAKYKIVTIKERAQELQAAMQRFNDPEHRKRYQRRGSIVEGVFGFIRSVLGYDRWLLRGLERVGAEGMLIALAYQFRTMHVHWAKAGA